MIYGWNILVSEQRHCVTICDSKLPVEAFTISYFSNNKHNPCNEMISPTLLLYFSNQQHDNIVLWKTHANVDHKSGVQSLDFISESELNSLQALFCFTFSFLQELKESSKRFDWKLFKRTGSAEEKELEELKWLMARLMNKNLFINRKRGQARGKFIHPEWLTL